MKKCFIGLAIASMTVMGSLSAQCGDANQGQPGNTTTTTTMQQSSMQQGEKLSQDQQNFYNQLDQDHQQMFMQLGRMDRNRAMKMGGDSNQAVQTVYDNMMMKKQK